MWTIGTYLHFYFIMHHCSGDVGHMSFDDKTCGVCQELVPEHIRTQLFLLEPAANRHG